MKPKSLAVVLALAIGALAGCASSLGTPTSADARLVAARWPGTTLGELQQGRRLYVATCAGCHNLRDPASLPPERWEKEVNEMRGRKGVHLGADDARLIIRYLSAMSLRTRAVAAR